MSRYKWIAARKAEGFPITMACKIAGGRSRIGHGGDGLRQQANSDFQQVHFMTCSNQA